MSARARAGALAPLAALAQQALASCTGDLDGTSGAGCDYLVAFAPGSGAAASAAAQRISSRAHNGHTLCLFELSDDGTSKQSRCERASSGSTVCRATIPATHVRLHSKDERRSFIINSSRVNSSGIFESRNESNIDTSRASTISFDKAIIIPGSGDFVLRRDAVDPYVLRRTWRTATDVCAALAAAVASGTPADPGQVRGVDVAVVGGGWPALRAIAQLRGACRLALLCAEPMPLADVLPRPVAEALARRIKACNVDVRPFTMLQYIAAPDAKSVELHTCRTFDALTTSTLTCQHLLLSPPDWSTPVSLLAEGAGTAGLIKQHNDERAREEDAWLNALEVDADHGGIAVNSELAACGDIFVAGSAISYPDPLFGRQRIQGNAEHDIRSALLAADNAIAGHRLSTNPGRPRPYSFVPVVCHDLKNIGMSAVTIGLVSARAESYAYWVRMPANHGGSRSRMLPAQGLGVILYVQPAEAGEMESQGLKQLRYQVCGALLWASAPLVASSALIAGRSLTEEEEESVLGIRSLGDSAAVQSAAAICVRLITSTMSQPLVPSEASFGDPGASREALSALLALPAASVVRALSLPSMQKIVQDSSRDAGPRHSRDQDSRGEEQEGAVEANELLADPFAAAKQMRRASAISAEWQLIPQWCPARFSQAGQTAIPAHRPFKSGLGSVQPAPTSVVGSVTQSAWR